MRGVKRKGVGEGGRGRGGRIAGGEGRGNKCFVSYFRAKLLFCVIKVQLAAVCTYSDATVVALFVSADLMRSMK